MRAIRREFTHDPRRPLPVRAAAPGYTTPGRNSGRAPPPSAAPPLPPAGGRPGRGPVRRAARPVPSSAEGRGRNSGHVRDAVFIPTSLCLLSCLPLRLVMNADGNWMDDDWLGGRGCVRGCVRFPAGLAPALPPGAGAPVAGRFAAMPWARTIRSRSRSAASWSAGSAEARSAEILFSSVSMSASIWRWRS